MEKRKRRTYRVKEHQLYMVKPSVWRVLRRQNKIDRIYRPRARRISFYSRLFAPLQLLQKLLYRKKINRISFEDNPPIFILGHWRSGTTHLHYMMARDPRLGYLNNYQALMMHVALLSRSKLRKMVARFFPKSRPQDNVRFTLMEPAEEEQPFSTITARSSIHGFFFPRNPDYLQKYHLFNGITPREKKEWQLRYRYLLKMIAFYNHQKPLVLKNPHNTGRVKELLELFPDARFILLHRNPYKVYLSTYHLYKRMVSTQFLQFLSLKDIRPMIIDNFKQIMEKYLRERTLIPDGHLVEIGFDDLENHPMETLKRIYTELSIPGFEAMRDPVEQYLDSVRKYRKNKFEALPEAIKERIDTDWDFYFRAFGYAKQLPEE
jgi:hypothetical protein